jgi:hypothetical protein
MKRIAIHAAICLVAFLLGVGAALYWVNLGKLQNSFQSSLPEVLSDFQLVAESSNDWDIPPHGRAAKPFPAKFEPGQVYILHHEVSISDTLLFEELLKRFRSKGINISEADASSKIREKDVLFRIAFEDGIYAGYIERPVIGPEPDDDGRDKCSLTDYILVITQAR